MMWPRSKKRLTLKGVLLRSGPVETRNPALTNPRAEPANTPVAMSQTKISFSGQSVTVGERTWQAPWPVKQALVIDDRVVLLYDYTAGPKHRQFRNLEAFTGAGERLWTAEHPGSDSADTYVEIMSTTPFV